MRLLIILTFVLVGDLSLAAGGSHDGIPWPTIIAQIFNVTIAIAILTYFLRAPLRSLFQGRVEKFDEEFKKAQKQKEAAEAKRNEIKARLENLKVTADQSILEAKNQAKANTKKLLFEADELARRMITESEGKVQNQMNKIVSELKLEILGQSFEKAREGLSDEISQPEINRLKQEFIKNIQVVQ